MVLNKIRDTLDPLVSSSGRRLGKAGFSPNFFTVAGFLLAILAGILFAARPSQTYLAGFSIIGAGLMDVLDGAVARALNRTSGTGSFNDSTLDRVAEVAIFSGILFANYAPGVVVILALSFSLLVSYARAKGDSLQIKLSGIGIGERAERLLVLVVFSLFGYVALGVYVVLALALITFVQRYIYIVSRLQKSPV